MLGAAELPPDVTSGPALRAWACAAHNRVNAALGKPQFNCARATQRWGGVECAEGEAGDDGGSACALTGEEGTTSGAAPNAGKLAL